MFKSITTDRLSNYAEEHPKFEMEKYFNGPIKAWGLIQDWRGTVVSRFDVDMLAKWEGNIGTLEEDFTYYNNQKQKRIWTITKRAEGQYQGEAADIIDKARGNIAGSAVRWKYQMDVPVGNTTYRLTFDDWMWQMNDGVLINRSYLKKFGFTVAELTLFMQKQDQQ